MNLLLLPIGIVILATILAAWIIFSKLNKRTTGRAITSVQPAPAGPQAAPTPPQPPPATPAPATRRKYWRTFWKRFSLKKNF